MPFFFFFILRMVFGRVMCISSNNWLHVWGGLEINLLSFIPIIVCSINENEVESTLKYFLVQALGSSLILLGRFRLYNYIMGVLRLSFRCILLLFSIIVKLGVFPFHYWLPQVILGLSWFSCIILSTWQKLGPIFIMLSIIDNIYSKFLLIVGSLRSLIGGLGGLNQSQIRALLSYSSIGHIGWMVVCIFYSRTYFIIYFILYCTINIIIMYIMIKIPSKLLNFMIYNHFPLYTIFLLGMLFLSLGGFPPLLGFYPKILVMLRCIENDIWLFLIILIGGSLLNIYYYLMVFTNLIIKSVGSGFLVMKDKSTNFRYYITLSWSSLLIILGIVLCL